MSDKIQVAKRMAEFYMSRQKKIESAKSNWLAVIISLVILIAMFALNATQIMLSGISDRTNPNQLEILERQYFLRLPILAPLLVLLWFSISRYQHERALEEDYANKALVAEVLPPFVDDILEKTSKNEVIVAATNVLFSAPAPKAERSVKRMLSHLGELTKIYSDLGKK